MLTLHSKRNVTGVLSQFFQRLRLNLTSKNKP